MDSFEFNKMAGAVLGTALFVMALGMAFWTLIPDKIEEEETKIAGQMGVFGATLVTFFLAEMGDKTQIATIALAAHYSAPLMVVAGTTLGMLIADVPAVFVGNRFAEKIPMKVVHSVAQAADGCDVVGLYAAGPIVRAFADVKDNSDSGQFMAVQKAAAFAL